MPAPCPADSSLEKMQSPELQGRSPPASPGQPQDSARLGPRAAERRPARGRWEPERGGAHDPLRRVRVRWRHLKHRLKEGLCSYNKVRPSEGPAWWSGA